MAQGNGRAPFRLDGKVAFITGSSTGLGKAMAFTLADAGAKVALNYYNNDARAKETMDAFLKDGREGIMLRG
ncbi:MAG: SDR family NAD(P)-dependent oxidoreductase, partial [Candidatus Hydrogenedentales bacterium]